MEPEELPPPAPSPDCTSLCPADPCCLLAWSCTQGLGGQSCVPALVYTHAWARPLKSSRDVEKRTVAPLPSPACCWGRVRAKGLSINAFALDRGPRVLHGRWSRRGGGARWGGPSMSFWGRRRGRGFCRKYTCAGVGSRKRWRRRRPSGSPWGCCRRRGAASTGVRATGRGWWLGIRDGRVAGRSSAPCSAPGAEAAISPQRQCWARSWASCSVLRSRGAPRGTSPTWVSAGWGEGRAALWGRVATAGGRHGHLRAGRGCPSLCELSVARRWVWKSRLKALVCLCEGFLFNLDSNAAN